MLVLALVFLVSGIRYPVSALAQCPDGAPPPCATTRITRTPAAGNSVAVLYFTPRDTADAFLADGLAEDVTSLLGANPSVLVKPRSVVQRVQRLSAGNYARIAQALGVRYLVNASLRRVGPTVRLNLELVDANRPDAVAWSNIFDRSPDRLPSLAADIATEVAPRIGGRSAPTTATATAHVSGGPAYESLLRGNYFLAQRTPASMPRAYQAYREAQRLDPAYAGAPARAAYTLVLARNYLVAIDGVPRDSMLPLAMKLADDALRLDSAASDAWMARAFVLLVSDDDRMERAGSAFQRAIALDPANAEARHQYASGLSETDDIAAEREYRAALRIEPGRAITLAELGYLRRRDLAEAATLLDSAIQIAPLAGLARLYRARVALLQRDWRRARLEVETIRQITAYDVGLVQIEAEAAMQAGDVARGNALLRELAPAEHTLVKLAAGDTAGALENVLRTRRHGPWTSFRGPEYDGLRSFPQFTNMMRELETERAR